MANGGGEMSEGLMSESSRLPVQGRVIWITGLSGAGKTTVAERLNHRLRESGANVCLLDGDQLRDVFQPLAAGSTAYDQMGRRTLALTYSRLCRLMASQGLTVIIATISLFDEVHRWNREHLPGYLEVFLDVPITELERRDPKSIYRRYRAGELTQVAGLDLGVDFPREPDLHITGDGFPTVDSIVSAIIRHAEVR